MSSRREFIRQSLYGGAGFALMNAFPFDALASEDVTRITILHTNDVHSRIEPFPLTDPKWPGLGGIARRAALIKKIREQEKHVLLLDAGDFFQGTPYFNLYGGELELKLMSEMGYDAGTLGNHDFDNGISGLVKQMPHASFPFLCANYDFSDTELNGKTVPYKIFKKDDIRIGVFGLGIELEGLVDKKMYGSTRYLDPLGQAAHYAHLLKKDEKCDLVVCLSHLGYKYQDKKVSDVDLAKQSKNIDLILGGHTHTLLEQPLAYRNSDNKEVLVAQVGWAGIRLGKIDFVFKKKNKKFHSEGTSIKISK
ncbi:MAG: metallophosphatase [Bacteroidota bacterium]